MNDERFTTDHHRNSPSSTDELDALLREWHTSNHEAAKAARARILAQLTAEHTSQADAVRDRNAAGDVTRQLLTLALLRRIIMHRYTRFAAMIIALTAIIAVLFPPQTAPTFADDLLMLPEGGQLEAFDERGESIGPVPLKHTDVDVHITGHVSRVTVNQQYHNPYDRKIEAVYTFPLSHRGAVDRMTMTIGDRVIEGEVEERQRARQIYEAARQQGYVASLLEQERPNIFTQSVANIEPGAEIEITISYVELVESVDGEYRFDFPMVVAPRYIPGRPISETLVLPEELEARRGVILQGPAEFGGWCGTPQRRTVDLDADGTLGPQRLAHLLSRAIPINQPSADWWGEARQPQILHHFTATYATGAKEFGMLHDDGTGQLNGRWFFYDAEALKRGGGFAPETTQVPDASRITPMPVRPEKRAGHDISVNVTIYTGGPAIREVRSPQHEIVPTVRAPRPGFAAYSLKTGKDIPNRDFILTWRTAGEAIEEGIFTHTGAPGTYGEYSGGFFTLVLQPPDRVREEDIRPREIIFVLDNSGSMRSARLSTTSALGAAKQVINQAIDTMRPSDRFNIISFNNTLDVLWDEPRANSPENRARAQKYVDDRQGGGGTEMRSAVLKALEAGPFARDDAPPRWMSPRHLLNQPADGREVKVAFPMDDLRSGGRTGHYVIVDHDLRLHLNLQPHHTRGMLSKGVMIRATGEWTTQDGRRVFVISDAEQAPLEGEDENDAMMRIVLFVTDGLVGNDDAIINAIRENAHNTRVFTIGMSRSPNRHLLDEMARAGRGAVDYVLPDDDVEPIVQRFADRIATPVLTDILLEFSNELEVFDVLPGLDRLPDLFDVEPLVIHGRYDPANAARGTLTIRGRTGAGPYERTIDLELPEQQLEHDVIATLWARAMVDERKRANDRAGMISLGKTFQIMTEHTSFVAVEKSRVTVDGKPMLVRVPIEFPKDMSWEGIFGGDAPERMGQRGEFAYWRKMTELRSEDAALYRVITPADLERAGASRQSAPPPPAAEPADAEPALESLADEMREAERRVRSTRPGRQFRIEEPRRAAQDTAVRSEGFGGLGGGFGGGGGGLGGGGADDARFARGLTGGGLYGEPEPDPAMDELVAIFHALGDDEESNETFNHLLRTLDRALLLKVYEANATDLADENLLVTVLLRDLEDSTIEQLTEHGFEVHDAVERGPFVVGSVALRNVKDLAQLDAVRRVELIPQVEE